MPKVGTISRSRTITYVTIACLALIPCDVYKDKQTYLSHLVLVLLCNMILHPKAQHKLVGSPFVWRHDCKYALWLMGAIQFMPKEGILSLPPPLYIQWARLLSCTYIVLASCYCWLVDAYNRNKVIHLREPNFDSSMPCPWFSSHILYHSLLAIYNIITRDLWMLIIFHSDQY